MVGLHAALKPYLFVTLCCLACSHPAAAAAATFKLTTTQQTVELGKPLWLNIRTEQQTPSLNDIDFSAVQDRFEVIKDQNEIRHTPGGQQWRVRLYPRRQGRFTIAGLTFKRYKNPPFAIQVIAPLDHKTGTPLVVDYHVSTHHPWLRQQVLVTYQLHSPSAHLVLVPGEASADDLLIIPLSTTTQQVAGQFIHSSGWAVFPRQSGTLALHLPALQYVRDGVTTHRFYPPPMQLAVKALPAYLPGNIPVGKLGIRLIAPSGLVRQNRLARLELLLTGTGIPRTWLPDIRYLFKSNEQLHLYPPDSHVTQSRANDIHSRYQYRLPFRAESQGRLTLPTLRLHYFDPATGKLASTRLPSQAMFVISSWLLLLGSGLLLLSGLWLLLQAYRWLLPRWQCLRAYCRALQSLPALQTPQQFKTLAGELAGGEGWPHNLSLRQWSARQPARVAKAAWQICEQLEPALYWGANCDTEQLRSLFQRLCLYRWPLLRWFQAT